MPGKDNKIFAENQKKGHENWKLTNPATKREIEGYASRSSINAGESIKLYISTKSNELSLTIFRMGWYEGYGGRQIQKPLILKGMFQDQIISERDSGLIKCDWTESYCLSTTKEWTTGIYLVKLEELKAGKQSYIIFVVRDDTRESEVLFQLPVTTYQAYNFWGGKSLYEWGNASGDSWGMVHGEKAYKVSFDRPYAGSNNKDAAFGIGAGEFFTNVQPVTTHGYPISSAAWDYNMVRWLEKNHYDVNYCTNIDTHARPYLLTHSKVFMSHGHDEYWSYEMRKNIENARDSGVNLTFFSSNTMFWQIRLENNQGDAEEPRTIICYKDSETDPVKGKKSSINFRDLKELKGEAEIIGVQYITDPVNGDIRITNSDHWVFAGTQLRNGSRLKGLLGYEIDCVCEDSPKNLTVLGHSPARKADENSLYILKYMASKVLNILKTVATKILNVKIGNLEILLFLLVTFTAALLLINKFFGFPFLLTTIGVCAALLTIWFVKIFFSKNFVSNMTLYQAESGAMVFATGSMQWSWGLDDYNTGKLRKKYSSKAAEIITKNILNGFISNSK